MSDSTPELTPSCRRSLRTALLRWFDRHGRRLPWREAADAYGVWISEIMLQQTTVAAVLPYYERFLARFPTIADLAAAPADDVLRLWEGLGYYSRARNLHAAARKIIEEFDGQLPASADELQSLPGIGRYTAAAIASFAFDQPAPIVEANTARLYARLIALHEPLRTATAQRRLWEFAATLMSRRRPGDLNLAAMDIGATICTPSEPACSECPLTRWCAAFASGSQQQIPVPDPKTAMTDLTEFLVAVCRKGRWLMRQRQPGERWAGLWDFVRVSVPPSDIAHFPERLPGANRGRRRHDRDQRQLFSSMVALPRALSRVIESETGLPIRDVEQLTEIRHVVTRYRIRLICCVADVNQGRVGRGRGYRWKSAREIAELPLPVTGRTVAELILPAN